MTQVSQQQNLTASTALQLLENTCGLFEAYAHWTGWLICSRAHDGHEEKRPIHHAGKINPFLTSQNGFPLAALKSFFDDTEHGLFHGLMTGFPMWVLSETRQFSPRYIATCVLHDFHRAVTGQEDDHDVALLDYFPKLGPAAYCHSNPKHAGAPLITGDRWELLRFRDSEEWVRHDELKHFPHPVLQTFYRTVRPALEQFWEDRDKVWIGHGPESAEKVDLKSETYPGFHLTSGICIELEKPPFAKCGEHGTGHLWSKLRGWRPLRSRDEVAMHPGGRDHLILKDPIPTKDWSFIGNGSFRHSGAKALTQQVVECGLPFVTRNALTEFWTTISLFEQRIVTLNHNGE